MVEEVRTEGDDPFDTEIDGDQTINPPAALITVHTPGDDGWTETETQVGHSLNTDTLTVIDELPNPESLAEHYDSESLQDVPDEYIFDNPGEAVEKAQEMGLEGPGDEITHTHGEGDSTVFMPGASHSDLMDMLEEMGEISDTGGEAMWSDDPEWASSTAADDATTETMNDTEKAILSAAEDVETPVEALESHAAAEDATVVEQSEYEALNTRVEALEEMMSDRLMEDKGLKEATVDAMSFEAMASEFETEDGAFDAEALVQNPETGQAETGGSDGVESLSDDADMDKAEALYGDYQMMSNPPAGLEEDITEALGVSDFDDAIEVLD